MIPTPKNLKEPPKVKYSIADIDTDLLMLAAFPRESAEDAEFRRIFGRAPDEDDRKLDLPRVIQIAQALEEIESDPLVAGGTIRELISAAIQLADRKVQP